VFSANCGRPWALRDSRTAFDRDARSAAGIAGNDRAVHDRYISAVLSSDRKRLGSLTAAGSADVVGLSAGLCRHDSVSRHLVRLFRAACADSLQPACLRDRFDRRAIAGDLQQLFLFRTIQALFAGADIVIGRAIIRDSLDAGAVARVLSRSAFALASGMAVIAALGWCSWALYRFIDARQQRRT
jgi:MFS family permease